MKLKRLIRNNPLAFIGALLGMYVFRHKTQQPLFKYGVPIILVLEIVLALCFTHMLYGWPV